MHSDVEFLSLSSVESKKRTITDHIDVVANKKNKESPEHDANSEN